MHLLPPSRWLVLAVVVATAGGCAVGPTYQQPVLATPVAYKEVPGWVQAVPADALDRGTWWALFDDAGLNALESRVEVSNQNIAAAAAAYAQARALVREQRAGLFPIVSLDGSGRRSGGEVAGAGNTYQASIGASWEPDVWGRLSRGVDSASASAQASSADLASALLSAQGELAINYFSLRQTDAQSALLQSTIAAYQRSLEIAQNRYEAGVAPKTDLLQAQTQLANAQAELVGLERQRTQLEHAIAVLVGQAPGNFTLVSAPWTATLPQVPIGVPSTLLQRRPDIAAAERRVAAANEQIGIAQSGLYPNLNLSASYGAGATRVSDLFSASTTVWSLGLSAAQVLFDAGATRERINQARAAQDQVAARYRQTVLVAFQGVEDQLASTRVLMQQQPLRELASRAADETEVQTLNRYRAGQVAYTEVVTAQASAFSARRALVQLASDRQVTAVALIQALGGGWGN
ncbi:efflux transporter outer membrane subunit [Actimicrobium sp. CCI2.3]|uniref:efflux transporter outer membrane subunit n=1 Tax=Actimicrobium sp. CCI2.3 TaxID=3048616 RepID=UPI002AB5B2E6|nr:efflux transporter outer membrane subunit [Actimicrobium sp. CCI2.3]MDY7575331.1 efflux transporter outer membrane subunit [Actimicrobium sp. CCI2.3]MEB0023679.1 efflux transporter outer membrane subunit [Actimicrobium sp. CCI2.3]